MLEIIDVLNKSVLSENCVLVSFDVVSIIPNIDNKSGFISVKEHSLIVILMLIVHNVFLML